MDNEKKYYVEVQRMDNGEKFVIGPYGSRELLVDAMREKVGIGEENKHLAQYYESVTVENQVLLPIEELYVEILMPKPIAE